eukprot:6192103-Pleurochrysis_carterae.AAC.4
MCFIALPCSNRKRICCSEGKPCTVQKDLRYNLDSRVSNWQCLIAALITALRALDYEQTNAFFCTEAVS